MLITIKGRPLRIVIDPGHGGSDPGAVGPNGTQESDVVLAVGVLLKKKLDAVGAHPWLTRSTDVSLRLQDRTGLAQRKQADLFLSLHCNAATAKAEGFEAMYGAGTSPKSLFFAQAISERMAQFFPMHKKRHLVESPSPNYPRSIYVVRHAPCPAALVELEFISHPAWELWLMKEETKNNLADCLCLAIIEFAKTNLGAKIE